MTGRIRGFDGIRTLALILVFFQHYSRIGQKFETGGYGVWMFFVLSGFLIVRILHGERERIEAGETRPLGAVGRFYWRRTLRIMPIYYLALGVMTVLGLLGIDKRVTWPATAWHYFYASNLYFGHIAEKWVGPMAHFWSLAIEEQFYLLAAPALLLFVPAGKARWTCGAMVVIAVLTSLMLRLGGANEYLLYNSSLINFGSLAAGGLMGLSLPKETKGGRNGWIGLGLVAAYFGVIWGMWAFPAIPADQALLLAAVPLIAASLLAALLLRTVFLNQASWLVAVLEYWPIRQLGRISYGFYLYHKLLPNWMVYWTLHNLGYRNNAEYWSEFIAAFLISLALASLSWVLIEKPLMGLKDRPPKWTAKLFRPETAHVTG